MNDIEERIYFDRKDQIDKVLEQQIRKIKFNPLYSLITGDNDAALVLSQIDYWSNRSKVFGNDGWFWKRDSDFALECMLTIRQFERIKKLIKKLPFVEMDVRGVPPKTFYRFNNDVFRSLIMSDGIPKYLLTFSERERQTTYLVSSKPPNGGNKTTLEREIKTTPKREIKTTASVEINNKSIIEDNNKDINTPFISPQGEVSSSKRKKRFVPPTLEEVEEYCRIKGYDPAIGRKAFEYYQEGDWHDSRGNKVRNWKQKILANWLKQSSPQGVPVGGDVEDLFKRIGSK
jgi:hypothetical protein